MSGHSKWAQIKHKKAANDAKALGRAQRIFAREIMPDLLGQAHRGMLGVKGSANL